MCLSVRAWMWEGEYRDVAGFRDEADPCPILMCIVERPINEGIRLTLSPYSNAASS